MKKFLATLGVMLLSTQNLAAAPVCAAHDSAVEQLAENFGETLQGYGLSEHGTLLEIFISQATGTWTITVTSPDGNTCIVVSGFFWEVSNTPLGDGA